MICSRSMTTETIFATLDEAHWQPACAGVPTARLRQAARAIVRSPMGVALLYSRRDRYHKLPGGGIEAGELPLQALLREAREEIGARLTDVQPLGVLMEHRRTDGLTQISHCYSALAAALEPPVLTDSEAAAGFVTVWLPLPQALARLRADGEADMFRRFIRQRELAILQHYQNALCEAQR